MIAPQYTWIDVPLFLRSIELQRRLDFLARIEFDPAERAEFVSLSAQLERVFRDFAATASDQEPS